jgi:arginyl-tRNA synthetase
MAGTRELIERRLRDAFDLLEQGADPVLRGSEHADYQANGALALAKRLGRTPRDVAEELRRTARLDDVCRSVEVSGPGFLNLMLSEEFMADQLGAMDLDARLGVGVAKTPLVVVVDYSAPNVAKEMHVGHLRSTIIGDALVRLLEFVGHRVVRENHIGDWGTPFGMLIEHLVDLGEQEAVEELSVGDLDTFYRQARESFDSDSSFRDRSRRRVVALQQGDEETLRLWRVLVAQSVSYFDEVYGKLDVLLTDDDIVGESFYNSMLAPTVAELSAKGLIVESEGALCVFPPGFTNRSGDPLPLIVQKSDEGFGYAATDLAALRDRVERIGAQRILYVVGVPQAQHLEMCIAAAVLAGWLARAEDAEHVGFGSVLGSDRKMFRTRAGASVKLAELLDEAVIRADKAIAARDPAASAAERAEVARSVGIGAVKFSDLSTDRGKDYVFDWDRMLAFEGSTGPYVQYAHARIRSILRRAASGEGDLAPIDPSEWSRSRIELADAAERALALCLLRFPDAVEGAIEGLAPSRMCGYLYELASTFTTFFERCPVLRAPSEELRLSRLRIANVTGRVLAQGLALIGITAPERM